MSILKVIEILAESPDGFDGAVDAAVTKAAGTIRNIRSVYVKEMSAEVADGKVVSYRVNAKITFQLDDQSAA